MSLMGMIEISSHDEIKKIYNIPANVKCCAVIAISITIALLLAVLIWM